MPQSPELSASESELIASCEAEIARFTAEREQCERKVRELMAAEDPARGIFHAQEIFLNQRDKLRLEVEIAFCRNKINRTRLGWTENAGAPDSGGLLF
ncbi:MAG: hypothetical protein KKA55_11080 [Proteobacteria bacterium]|nr:hypothetical protein [Pseudomonadota bacterium]MBU1596062.1 hypothetical protein [Pseudomonadota bacterium]